VLTACEQDGEMAKLLAASRIRQVRCMCHSTAQHTLHLALSCLVTHTLHSTLYTIYQ
jgi:hypothetical protein